MNLQETAAQALADIVKLFVFQPESVRVESKTDDRGLLLTLFVHPEDLRYCIGKEGRVAVALRTIMKMVGSRHQGRVAVQIYESEASREAHLRSKQDDSLNV